MTNNNPNYDLRGLDIPAEAIRKFRARQHWRETHVETEPDTCYPDPTGNTAVANIMAERRARATAKRADGAHPLRVGDLAPTWKGYR